MRPDGFADDLSRKPEVLQRLAATLALGNPWADVVAPGVKRVVLLGMGSSAYAGGVAAARMRSRGLVTSSELAASRLLPGWGAGRSCFARTRAGPPSAARPATGATSTCTSPKTTDYRLLVFAGSPWETQLAGWTTARGSTVVAVGGTVPGARYELRYPGDTEDDVRLLAEEIVPELISARACQAGG